MKPYEEMEHHPLSEQLVDILRSKTHNQNPLFFRVLVAYYAAQMASMMRTDIATMNQGKIPVNLYAINLAPSGTGKGHSVNIMEDSVTNKFRRKFEAITFPALADKNLAEIAKKRAQHSGNTAEEEYEKAQREFFACGPYVFSFDSGTSAAIKQCRHKLLLAGVGSMNLQMDEMGANLLSNIEVLNTYIELYDVGKLKTKLIKNTQDNARLEAIDGRTPTNMLLFGTPSRLLDGSKSEDEFVTMLIQGYARRCLFGYIKQQTTAVLSSEDIMKQWSDTSHNSILESISDDLSKLADPSNFGRELPISDANSEILADYMADCKRRAATIPSVREVNQAEMEHRHFKAMKIAGAYAFIDNATEITEDHLYSAIALVEESGEAFNQLLTRDKSHARLAKYIAEMPGKLTQADLVEDLPFYKGSNTARNDMMNLAIAYGYQHNIIIKREMEDGIEFIKGETLEETDLNKIVVSYGTHVVHNYRSELVKFDQLHRMTQVDGVEWINHHLIDGENGNGYRSDENCKKGFNTIVIDVDGGVDLQTAKTLLKGYKAHYYTTKRHTEQENRFRIILPTNYKLEMDSKDYKEFMNSLFEWLPFDVDDQTGQRSRKWLSHKGHYEYTDGDLIDVLPFIPKTSKNEKWKANVSNQQSLDNIERWVVNTTNDGNRNNQLYRYAMILVDAGFSFEPIRQKVLAMNSKLPDPLAEAEIMATVMVSVGKAISAKP